MSVSSEVSIREELLHLRVNIGNNTSLKEIAQQINYVHSLTSLCEKLVLTYQSEIATNIGQVKQILGSNDYPASVYENAQISLGREASDIQYFLKIKALAEYDGLEFPELSIEELARAAMDIRKRNEVRLLNVSTMRYKNPLDALIAVIPEVLEQASWAAHGAAALLLSGGFLTAIRKWQTSGLQLELQRKQLEIQGLEIEAKKSEADKDKIDMEVYRRQAEVKLEVIEQMTSTLKEGAGMFIGDRQNANTSRIMGDLVNSMNINLLKLPDAPIQDAMEALMNISKIEDASVDS